MTRSRKAAIAKRGEVTDRDVQIFCLHTQRGTPLPEIAKIFQMDEVAVQEGFVRAYCHFAVNSPANTASSLNSVLRHIFDKVRESLTAGLSATKRAKASNGVLVEEPDNEMRLATIDRVTDLLKVMFPKQSGAGVNVNVGMPGQTPKGAAASSGPMSFEALLDRVKGEALETEASVEVEAEEAEDDSAERALPMAEPPANA